MENKKDYHIKYDREKTRRYGLKFMLERDRDIIAKLDSVPNKNDYIRRLILHDISKTNK